LRPKGGRRGIIPAKGGLDLDPPLTNLVERKSHLLKAQEKALAEIRKGKQASIARALE